MNFILPLFFIFFFLLSWKRIEMALILLIFSLPAYIIRFNIFNVPTTLLEAMIWIVFIVYFIKYSNLKEYFKGENKVKRFIEDRKKRKAYPFSLEIILLLIISYISAGVSGFNLSSLGIWKAYFFDPLILFIVIFNIFVNLKNIEKMERIEKSERVDSFEEIIISFALSAFAVSIFAIYQKITGEYIPNEYWFNEETRRVTSFFGYPNAVGLYLGPIVLLLVGFLGKIIEKIKNKFTFDSLLNLIFVATTILISIISIYFAKSEGALVGVLAGLIVFGALCGKKIRLATLIIIIFTSLFIYFYQPANNFVIKKITLSDLSGQIRSQQWKETWKMLKDGKIILGAGLENYQKVMANYHQEGIFVKNDDPNFLLNVKTSAEYRKKVWQPLEIYLYPHNIFLNFWSELGFFGMLLFIFIILKYFYIAVKNIKFDKYRYITLGLVSAMVAIFVNGLVDVPYFKNDLSAMFWILVAMIGIINLHNKIKLS